MAMSSIPAQKRRRGLFRIVYPLLTRGQSKDGAHTTFSGLIAVVLKPNPPNTTFRKAKAMSTNTIQLHRVLRATPERVYRAFLEADAMAK